MNYWTKEQEITLINQTQDEYVTELIEILNSSDPSIQALEEVNFTSPTGTGKTKMMSKIINRMPNDYFIITTLSKGQLHKQVHKAISEDCVGTNYKVYGVQSYTKNSLLQDDDILADIQNLPANARVFWFRDEGHIKSNKWMQLLQKRCDKIVNWSATNHDAFGVKCNFVHTMMLRTVQQIPGDIDMALDKLLEVKQQHKGIAGYNPCAIIRLTSTALLETVAKACKKRKLSYISLLQNDDYDMSELCEDNCEYDVIINQQKIVEGIDVRRAHVLWMENEPAKAATTIQMIGRCRRNALLWRNDIDICAPENKELLEHTRQCFAFYNEKNMKIAEDETGELAQEFCPIISVEKLKCGATIHVIDGRMSNGLLIEELAGCTGEYTIKKDPNTDFHVVDNPEFYETQYMIRGLQFDRQEPLQWLHQINEHLRQHPQWTSNAAKELSKYVLNEDFLYATYHTAGNEVLETTRQYCLDETGHFEQTTQSIVVPHNSALALALKHHPCVYAHSAPHELLGDKITLTIAGIKYNIFFTEFTILLKKQCLTVMDLDARRFKPENWTAKYTPDICVINNTQLATIGPEAWRIQRTHTYANMWRNGWDEYNWVPDVALTKLTKQHNKLTRFLRNIYLPEYTNACQETFKENITLSFPKMANRALGFIVEYFAKAEVYGNEYLEPYYSYIIRDEAKDHAQRYSQTAIRIRACFVKYREEIKRAYNLRSARFLPTVGLDKLMQNEYAAFLAEVERLGTQTAEFLRMHTQSNDSYINPIVQTPYLAGLMDVITQDTIIDIKCTGAITPEMILQVLAYAYLSQYIVGRHIKRAIIYEAYTNRSLCIPLPNFIVCHESDDLLQQLQHKLLAAQQYTPSSISTISTISKVETSDSQLARVASLLSKTTQAAFDEHVIQYLQESTINDLLERCTLRRDIQQIIIEKYTNPATLFQDLCVQHQHVYGIGNASIEEIKNQSYGMIESYGIISDNSLTTLQTIICEAIRKYLLPESDQNNLHKDVIQRFSEYATAWRLMSYLQPLPKHMRFILQTTKITGQCDYWDDEYIASRRDTDTEVPL